MKTPEAYEKDDICKYLVSLAAWHFRPFMAGYGKSGVSDIIACIPVTITPEMVGMRIGVFCGIEVKRDGKELTALQNERMTEIKDSGGFAVWGTAERVIPLLKRLPYE
jgi:hypothetical protein